MVLGAAAAAYLGWVWIPVYVLHYEVKQVVRDFANQSVKARDDAALVARMADRIRALRQESAPGPDGRPVARPAVDLRPQDVTWEREGDVLHVAFDYERDVAYPILDRTVTEVMNVDLTLDVTRADWSSAR
jgi:hypothetical protein